MIRKISPVFIIIMVTISIQPFNWLTIHAQDDVDEKCDDIIAEALQVVGSACTELGHNEACYGNTLLSAEFTDTQDQQFEDVGDIVDALNLTSLKTESIDLEQGVWGIALMQLLADLPEDEDYALTLVLLGDAQLDTTENDEFQAFTLNSGENSTCTSAPDGLLVQAPTGQRARIVVNGVELTFSSAAFLTAEPDDQMTIQVMEGSVDAASDNQTVTIVSGFYSSVPLDELTADGAPSEAEPFEFDHIDKLMTLATLFNQVSSDFGVIPDTTEEAAILPGTRIVIDVPDGFTGVAMYLGPPTADCVEPAIDDTIVPEGEMGTVIAGPFFETCSSIPYYLLYMDIGRIGWEGDGAFRTVE